MGKEMKEESIGQEKQGPGRIHKTYPGYPLPLGVHLHDDGALFAVFSRHASDRKSVV